MVLHLLALKSMSAIIRSSDFETNFVMVIDVMYMLKECIYLEIWLFNVYCYDRSLICQFLEKPLKGVCISY